MRWFEQFFRVPCHRPEFPQIGIHLEKNQRIRLETPGGGGYGHAFERNPQLVAEDVRLGYVTVDSASKHYKCCVSPDGILDQKETNRLRELS